MASAVSARGKTPFATLWPAIGDHCAKNPGVGIDAALKEERNSATSKQESARDQVLRTHELLENIIVHLPWANLFKYQRVSQSWSSVIQTSPAIQNRMFLASTYKPLTPASDLTFYGGGQVTHTAYRDEITYMSPINPVPGLTYCPPVPSTTCPFGDDWMAMDMSSETQICICITGVGIGTQKPYQSWRRMFLTKPPVTAVDLKILPSRYQRDHKKHLTVYNLEGLRLGELYDWIWKLCRETEREAGFVVRGRLADISFCLIANDDESGGGTRQSD